MCKILIRCTNFYDLLDILCSLTKKVVEVWVISCWLSITAIRIIVSLVSLMIYFLRYVWLLNPIIWEFSWIDICEIELASFFTLNIYFYLLFLEFSFAKNFSFEKLLLMYLLNFLGFFLLHLEPLILKNLIHCYSLIRVSIEHLLEEINKRVTHIWIVKCESASLNPSIQILICCSSKRKAPIQKCIEKDTTCPNISGWSTIFDSLLHNLWSHVRRCPTKEPKLFIIGYASTETKVNQFNALSIII